MAAAALKSLFNKRQMALTKARFRAWWDGVEFDAAAAEAEISAANDAAPMGDADDALFDAPPYEMPPRLSALSVLWGPGRVRPGDDGADALESARIGAPGDGVVAVLGPGMAGPVAAFAGAYAGKIDVFEWREETLDALKHGVAKARLDARISVARIDMESHVWTPNAYDGLWSVDDFAYCSFPPHLAQQIMKCLKPGACAVVESYVGLPCAELATAFASSFAEPQIRAHGDVLQVLADVGLVLEADEDVTEAFLEIARTNFRELGAKLGEAAKLDVAAARELAWEAEAWRMRLRLLGQRRLERRRLVLRKPAEGANAPAPEDAPQAEKENAPAA